MKGLRLVRGGVVLALMNFVCDVVRLAVAEDAPALGMSEPSGNKCWVFTHQNKAGGTTVKNMLHNIWGPRAFVFSGGVWRQGNAHTQSIAEELVQGQTWSAIGGGYAEALRRSSSVGSKCKWFTVFRHPISRAVSAYYFCKRSRSCSTEIVNAHNVDLVTFAKYWGNYSMKQFVLSFVSTDDVRDFSHTDAALELLPETADPKHVPEWYWVNLYLENQNQALASINTDIPDAVLYTMLQPVRDLLRDQYSVVGILEDFNTTLSLFNAVLDVPNVDWHEEFLKVGESNVNNKFEDEKVASLADAWTNSEIKKYMQLDLMLYEHAVDLFNQQARAYDI